MSDRNEGLKHKYNVERVDGKPVGDCIVLEFSDPNAHDALLKWADTVEVDGYHKLAADVRNRVLAEQDTSWMGGDPRTGWPV